MTEHMQRIMKFLLENLRVVPFQNNVAVALTAQKEHIKAVKEALNIITYTAELRINFKKYKFFKTKAWILEITVSKTDLKMDTIKLNVIPNWPRPKNGKSMQRSGNFHREFTFEFAMIV